MWAQLGFGGAFFGLAAFVLQAGIRGTWIPRSTVELLMKGKNELLGLKDQQNVLLANQVNVLQTTNDAQVKQITGLVEATGAMKHFFLEVPVVPSTGGNTEKIET
jgi:hypothetical protein